MEQITQLFEILKQTPQLAIWGLVIWCLFVLAKIASWVGAITIILRLLITRYFNAREEELKQTRAAQFLKYFEDESISSDTTYEKLTELMRVMKTGAYIHGSDIENAIKAVQKYKSNPNG